MHFANALSWRDLLITVAVCIKADLLPDAEKPQMQIPGHLLKLQLRKMFLSLAKSEMLKSKICTQQRGGKAFVTGRSTARPFSQTVVNNTLFLCQPVLTFASLLCVLLGGLERRYIAIGGVLLQVDMWSINRAWNHLQCLDFVPTYLQPCCVECKSPS